MQVIEDLVYRLVADASSLEGSLQKAESQVQKSADKIASTQGKNADKSKKLIDDVEATKSKALKRWERDVETAVKQQQRAYLQQIKEQAREEERIRKLGGKFDDNRTRERLAREKESDRQEKKDRELYEEGFRLGEKAYEHEKRLQDELYIDQQKSEEAIQKKKLDNDADRASRMRLQLEQNEKKEQEQYEEGFRLGERLHDQEKKNAEDLYVYKQQQEEKLQEQKLNTELNKGSHMRLLLDEKDRKELKAAEKEAEIAEKKRLRDQELYEEGFRLGEQQYDQEKKNIEDSYLLKQQLSEKQAEQEKNDDLDKASRFRRMLDERDAAIEKAAEKQKRADEAEELRKKKALERHERDEAEARHRRIREEKRADEQIHANRKRLLSMLNMLLVSIGVPRFYKGIVKEASNALEANNKLRAVFYKMNEEATAAAASLSRYYGVSTVHARSMLADTGNILTNFGIQQKVALQMSEQINKLGVDLASFVNYQGGAAGAANALTKALLGEREAAKALGVAITENDVKNLAKTYGLATTGLTRQQRALLTLEVMLKQTKNAQGDFERSSHDLENQTRILNGAFDDLKLVLGEEVIPVVIKAVGATTEVVNAIKDADPLVHGLILTLPALALGVKAVGLAIKGVQLLMAGGSAFSLLSLAFVGISAGLATLLTVANKINNKTKDFSGSVDELSRSLRKGNDIIERRNKLLGQNKDKSDEATESALKALDAEEQVNDARTKLHMEEVGSTYKAKTDDLPYVEAEIERLRLERDAYALLINDPETFDKTLNDLYEKNNLTEEEIALQKRLTEVNINRNKADKIFLSLNDELDAAEKEHRATLAGISQDIEKLALDYKDNTETLEKYKDLLGEDLYEAVMNTIQGFKDLVKQGYDVADAISASEYVTKDWVSLLDKVEKSTKEAADAELEEAGAFDQLSKQKIAALQKEREEYSAYIDKREIGLMMENEKLDADEKTLAQWKEDNTEWQSLQKDRVDMDKYYEKQELYWIEYYSKKKLEAYEDFQDGLKSLRRKVMDSDEDQLKIDREDLLDEYNDIVKLLGSSYGLSDKILNSFMGAVKKAAENDGILSDGMKAVYEKMSPERQKLFDELLALTMAYYDADEKLQSDHKKKKQAAIDDWKSRTQEVLDRNLNDYERAKKAYENYTQGVEESDEEFAEHKNYLKAEMDAAKEDLIKQYREEAEALKHESVPAYQRAREAFDAFIATKAMAEDMDLWNAEKIKLEAEAVNAYNDAIRTANQTYSNFFDDIVMRDATPIQKIWAIDYMETTKALKDACDREVALYESLGYDTTKVVEKYAYLQKQLLQNSITDTIQGSLDMVMELTNGLESLLSKFSDNQIQVAENRRKYWEDQKNKLNKEAKDAGRALTKSEKDELKRREKDYEEHIAEESENVRKEKEKQFEMQKAFAISEATITGIQATLEAYLSGSKVHWSLGAIMAAAAASFVGAQIAAIAQQPMPSYDVGAWEIDRDHQAVVHAGEAILPKPFAESFRENGGNLGGQGVVVNVYGATDDVTVEEGQSEDGKMRQIDIYMSSKVRQMVATGQLDAPLQARYDLSRRGRRA